MELILINFTGEDAATMAPIPGPASFYAKASSEIGNAGIFGGYFPFSDRMVHVR